MHRDDVLILEPGVNHITGVVGVLAAWIGLHAGDRQVRTRDREVLVPELGEGFLVDDQLAGSDRSR